MNLLEQLVHDHREQWDLPGLGRAPRVVLVTPAYDTSRHVVALVFGERALCAVIKVARRPGDISGLLREADLLRRLEELRGVSDDVPRLLGLLPLGGSTALAETALTGPALGPERVRAQRDEVLRAGTAFVEGLPVTGTHTGSWYDDLVAAPVERLLSSFDEIASDELAARTHKALARLRTAELPAVLEHGDLSHPNLLLVAPGRLGAVDWERAVDRGLPGHDLVYLLAYVSEALTGAATVAERIAAFGQVLGRDGWGRAALTAHLEQRDVVPSLSDALILTAVVRAACTLTDRLLGDAAQGQAAAAGLWQVAARDRDVVLWRHLLEQEW